jgi:hypothetical protein
MASHALLLCNVLMKCARLGSVASTFATSAAVLIGGGSLTADSCGYACGAWSNVGGGVTILGDGVGDGDNDSEGVGVEPVECYFPAGWEKDNIKGKGTRVSNLTDEKEAAPRSQLPLWAGDAGASAR